MWKLIFLILISKNITHHSGPCWRKYNCKNVFLKVVPSEPHKNFRKLRKGLLLHFIGRGEKLYIIFCFLSSSWASIFVHKTVFKTLMRTIYHLWRILPEIVEILYFCDCLICQTVCEKFSLRNVSHTSSLWTYQSNGR